MIFLFFLEIFHFIINEEILRVDLKDYYLYFII